MRFSNPVMERKLSGFQLSLSTGFAMETLFAPRTSVYDSERVPQPRASLKNYDSIYINVDTLLRNMMNACTFEDLRQIRPENIGEALLEEVEQIHSLASNEGKGLIKPVFYLTNYANFYRNKSAAYKLRSPTSELQRQWFITLVQGRASAIQQGLRISYIGEDVRPERPTERSLLLSHITPDLLSYRNFGSLELLESHTGKIKTRREWASKYNKLGGEVFGKLPWCKPLLCYFGDKYVLSPLSITIRRRILKVAEDRRWTPMTQSSSVYNDLMSKITDIDTLKILREISLY